MKTKILFLMSAILFISNYSKADETEPEFKISQCTKCHTESPDLEKDQFPRLAGQTPEYLTSSILAYKNHKRTRYGAEKLMWQRVNFDDDRIQKIADYFSKLIPKAGIPTDPVLVAAGKKLYEEGVPDKNVYACNMCHGDKAEGSGGSPRLAGQYKIFLINQLRAYQKDQIAEDQGMKDVAVGLATSEIDALASYLQSL